MTNNERILQKIIKVVNKNDPDSEVYLYGSRATGKAQRLSDWDLLILLNRPNIPVELEVKFMDDLYDVELETGSVISPLIYSKSDWINNYAFSPLFENIKNEGIQLK